MHADGCHNRVLLRINHTDIVRSGIDHIDFILFAVGGNTSGSHTHGNSFPELKRTQINHCDCITFSIGDVGILTGGRTKITQVAWAEVQPTKASDDCQEDNDEKNFSQGRTLF